MTQSERMKIAEAVRDATRDAVMSTPTREYGECDSEAEFDACMSVDLAAILATIPPEPVAVPDGWKLVPKEPTREMLDAAHTNFRRDVEIDPLLKTSYRAMLAAAPHPEVQQQDDINVVDLQPEQPAKLVNPVRIGGINFHKGVSVESAIRHAEKQYQWWQEGKSNPEQPAQALTDEEIHAALIKAVADTGGDDTPEPPNLNDFMNDPRYAGTLEFTRAFAHAIEARVKAKR